MDMGAGEWACCETVGSSIPQEKQEMKRCLVLLVRGRRPSKSVSGFSIRHYEVAAYRDAWSDLIYPRRSSALGRVAAVYLYVAVLCYIPTPIAHCSYSMQLLLTKTHREVGKCVWKATVWDLGGKSTCF